MIFTSSEWDALRGDVEQWKWPMMRQELLEPILADRLEAMSEAEAASLEVAGEYPIDMEPFRNGWARITVGSLEIRVQDIQLIPTIEPQRHWIVKPEVWT